MTKSCIKTLASTLILPDKSYLNLNKQHFLLHGVDAAFPRCSLGRTKKGTKEVNLNNCTKTQKKENYIRVDTDFIFTTIKVNLDVNYRQFKDKFLFFALMKCSFAAFGEQNKIDNDSKCQQVYKSQKKRHSFERLYIPYIYKDFFAYN